MHVRLFILCTWTAVRVCVYWSYFILNKITLTGYRGHLWTSGGSNHGVRAVFTIIIILEYFATEFRSYPPLKVMYHPAGFYNSPMSLLWKTRCIIIAIYTTTRTHYIYDMNTVNRRTRYNGNAETSFSVDLPAPDCLALLMLQVYQNWSDFFSVKSNSLVS